MCVVAVLFYKVEMSSEDDPLNKKRSNHLQRKLDARKSDAKIDSHLEEQFNTGRIYGSYDYAICFVVDILTFCIFSLCFITAWSEW